MLRSYRLGSTESNNTTPLNWGKTRASRNPGAIHLPKSGDLGQLDQVVLDAIAAELNGRPRQTLGFKTPSQVLAEALP
jgi:hypothetical protein